MYSFPPACENPAGLCFLLSNYAIQSSKFSDLSSFSSSTLWLYNLWGLTAVGNGERALCVIMYCVIFAHRQLSRHIGHTCFISSKQNGFWGRSSARKSSGWKWHTRKNKTATCVSFLEKWLQPSKIAPRDLKILKICLKHQSSQ